MSGMKRLKAPLRISPDHFTCPYCGRKWRRPSADPSRESRSEGFVKAAARRHVRACPEARRLGQ